MLRKEIVVALLLLPFLQSEAIASNYGLADVPFKDIVAWKRAEVKDLRIADYAIFWGESNPPLSALIKGEKPQLSPSSPIALGTLPAAAIPTPPPFLVDKSLSRMARTINKSCTSNYIVSDAAQYRSQTICTAQVADKDFLRGNGYKTTGVLDNMEFGMAPDGASFLAIYSSDKKIRHLVHIFSYFE